MRWVASLLLLAMASAVDVHAQGTGRVSGVVFDSLARQPLAGAEVQLLRVDPGGNGGDAYARFASSDARGAFQFDSLIPGAYTIGFFHARVDSLGIDLPPQSLAVAVGDQRVTLVVPSYATLIERLCGRESATDSSAVIVGFVRDAASARPAAGAQVLLEWEDVVFGRGTLRYERQHVSSTTRGDGWYALCNIPVSYAMQLRVARGADTSGAVEARLVGGAITAHDLAVGPVARALRVSQRTVGADSRRVEDSLVVWSGTARLAGVVRAADGRPLAGARVAVAGTDAVGTTGENGAFLLSALPSGSQTLLTRAIGFVPGRATVALMPDTVVTAPPIALTKLQSFLDTVRVTATRLYSTDPTGFEARRRSGIGEYLDRTAIARQNPFFPSDLVRMLPGVDVAQSGAGFFGRRIFMRTLRGVCLPTLYVDGFMYKPGEALLDDLVAPDEIDGMEVYTRQSKAPVQFMNTMSGCGSVVVWTRPPPSRKK